MTEPTVAIVIPNLHSPVIGEVLAALLSQIDSLAVPAEVWVVGQDRYDLVQASEKIHVLETREPVPPSRARNLGAAAATGSILIFLDSDCVPQLGWLAGMLRAFERWPEAGAISGSMLPKGGTPGATCMQVAVFHEHLQLNAPGSRSTLASFSLLIPHSLWEAVHGFNEEFRFAAAEDLDLSIRIALQGRSLYFEPGAAVCHKPSRKGWQALWRYAQRSGSQSIVVRRHYADYYQMPAWSNRPWAWRVLSPLIALARTSQIFVRTPGLWHYRGCAPAVFISKLAWCWGAAAGLEISARPILHKFGE
jgi:GT2 family glycosyltransferase